MYLLVDFLLYLSLAQFESVYPTNLSFKSDPNVIPKFKVLAKKKKT